MTHKIERYISYENNDTLTFSQKFQEMTYSDIDIIHVLYKNSQHDSTLKKEKLH